MELLDLFISFVKIGFTSFGGLSMIPLITSEMLSHGWMTTAEITDIVAIAEMTPGPLGLNCATFAGIRTAGLPGAIVANLGVMFPSLTLTAVAAIFFERFKNSSLLTRMIAGIRPACVGMIFGVLLSLSLTNYVRQGVLNPIAICIGIVDILLLFKFKLSIPKTILFSGLAGFVLFGLLQL